MSIVQRVVARHMSRSSAVIIPTKVFTLDEFIAKPPIAIPWALRFLTRLQEMANAGKVQLSFNSRGVSLTIRLGLPGIKSFYGNVKDAQSSTSWEEAIVRPVRTAILYLSRLKETPVDAPAAKPTVPQVIEMPATAKRLLRKLGDDAVAELKATVAALPTTIPARDRIRLKYLKRSQFGWEYAEIYFDTTVEGYRESSTRLRIQMEDNTVEFTVESGQGNQISFVDCPWKKAPAMLSTQLRFLKSDLQYNVDRALNAAAMMKERRKADPYGDIREKLQGINLGPTGGRVIAVETIDGMGEGEWSIEPSKRARLDHYGNGGDGWDDDAWSEEYADPLYKAAEAWLEHTFGKGFFDVSVDEKGFLDVGLTPLGKRELIGK